MRVRATEVLPDSGRLLLVASAYGWGQLERSAQPGDCTHRHWWVHPINKYSKIYHRNVPRNIHMQLAIAKGSCQVKKNPKIREKIGLARRHPPTPVNFFIFFWKDIQQEITTQKQKKQNIQKKRKIRVGASYTHPPTPKFFSDFWISFNLTKPLIILICFI